MIIDILVLIIVLGSMIIAFLRGFIREVLTIFGIIGGAVAAYIGGPLLMPTMYGWLGITNEEEPQKLFDIVPYPLVADALSYGAVFIVFVIILSIISHFIAEFAKNLGLGILDRTLGLIFGFVRGVLVLGLLYLPFFYLVGDEQKEEWFKGSKTQTYLEMTSSWIDQFIPKVEPEEGEESDNPLKDISGTRKKLEEMDLLKSTSEDARENINDEAGSIDRKEGYSPEFREKMDQLFEHNVDTSPEYNE